MRRTIVTGLVAALVAMVATTAGAALARTAGVDLLLPGAAEPIPVAGVGVMTGMFSVVGIVLAVALLRWTARPAERGVQVAVALVVLHLVAAVVMIPALSRGLRERELVAR